MLKVAIAGAETAVGAELLRILLAHQYVSVEVAVSDQAAGQRVTDWHPQLRGRTGLSFAPPAGPTGPSTHYDVVFVTGNARAGMAMVPDYLNLTDTLIDLTGAFSLKNPQAYAWYYGMEHIAPDLLVGFVPGLPELYRERLREANLITVPSAMGMASILAVHPLAERHLIHETVYSKVQVGSASLIGEGSRNCGEEATVLRHWQEVEIAQTTSMPSRMSITAGGNHREVRAEIRLQLGDAVSERDVRSAYREAYEREPGVRCVTGHPNAGRPPVQGIVIGTNICEVSVVAADGSGRATLSGTLDGFIKGSAGSAVQSMNVRYGWPEQTALDLPGLAPG